MAVGNFEEAWKRLNGICIFCGNDQDNERRGNEWFCPCCSRTWPALNRNDEEFLKSIRVRPS